MRTPANLWLWRYKSDRPRYAGYHLFADRAACDMMIVELSKPDFIKLSLALRPVPEKMPRILAPEDIRHKAFSVLRLYVEPDADRAYRWEEADGQLDLYLNAVGHKEMVEGLGYLAKGDWDYRMGDISYWGLLTEAEYQKRYIQ